MLTLTLDTNCIINLENGTGQSRSVHALIELHRDGKIEVALNAASAGENLPGKVAPTTSVFFESLVEKLRLTDLPQVAALPRLGTTFFLGVCEFADETDVELEERIKGILFPAKEPSFGAYLAEHDMPLDTPATPRWRNIYSDVDAILGHIRSGRDVFVTEDRRFLRAERCARLVALGASAILRPDDALQRALRV